MDRTSGPPWGTLLGRFVPIPSQRSVVTVSTVKRVCRIRVSEAPRVPDLVLPLLRASQAVAVNKHPSGRENTRLGATGGSENTALLGAAARFPVRADQPGGGRHEYGTACGFSAQQ